MKGKNKNILITFLICLFILLLGIYYILNMPHRNIEKEIPSYSLSVDEIFTDFNQNELSSNIKYGNKVVQVTGSIVEISNNDDQISIVLKDEMEGANCLLDPAMVCKDPDLISRLDIGNNITIKGKCDGFDMIMGVVLTQCFIVKYDENNTSKHEASMQNTYQQ